MDHVHFTRLDNSATIIPINASRSDATQPLTVPTTSKMISPHKAAVKKIAAYILIAVFIAVIVAVAIALALTLSGTLYGNVLWGEKNNARSTSDAS